MDPDKCWEEILELLAGLQKEEDEDDRDELVEHLRNLADWIGKGGFVPRQATGFVEA